MEGSKQKTLYISIKIIYNESNDTKINVYLLTIYNILVALYSKSKFTIQQELIHMIMYYSHKIILILLHLFYYICFDNVQ